MTGHRGVGELAKSGRGAVQRELARLHKGGLVTVHKIATQKHFQANVAMMPVERVLARPISLTLYTEVDFQERLDNENPFISRILSSPTINLIGSVDAK